MPTSSASGQWICNASANVIVAEKNPSVSLLFILSWECQPCDKSVLGARASDLAVSEGTCSSVVYIL